jgi:hypothetical protein
VSDRPPRRYEIAPEPAAQEQAAIVEALERRSQENARLSHWELRARREVVDDGVA